MKTHGNVFGIRGSSDKAQENYRFAQALKNSCVNLINDQLYVSCITQQSQSFVLTNGQYKLLFSLNIHQQSAILPLQRIS